MIQEHTLEEIHQKKLQTPHWQSMADYDEYEAPEPEPPTPCYE